MFRAIDTAVGQEAEGHTVVVALAAMVAATLVIAERLRPEMLQHVPEAELQVPVVR
ncbi:hypothetical protein D3C71_1834500 [compost metagenome]